MVKFCAFLVAKGLFTSVSCPFFRVGHTHNKVDQRFAVIGSTLSKSKTLEDPEAWRAHHTASKLAERKALSLSWL